MANDLISRKALIADLLCAKGLGKIIAETIVRFVEKQPTVDAEPVVYGHWYKAQHHPYRCSNCGEMALLDMYGESHYRSNYCPNCGADMRGTEE